MAAAQRTKLLGQVAPRTCEPFHPYPPHPGPQQLFLTLDHVNEAFYGGAAGGGKSDALLWAALQYVDVPGYAALVLRRTWQDLTLPGAIMDRAWDWLKPTPARPVGGGRAWAFPSGARLQFGYVMYHKDVDQFASAEFQYIGIDELSRGWEERTYEFLFSRLRKPDWLCRGCQQPLMRALEDDVHGTGFVHRDVGYEEETGLQVPVFETGCDWAQPNEQPRAPDGLGLPDVPLRMRSSSNPGGSGHAWVKKRFVDSETRRPESVFIPASLADNPSLNRAQYVRSLEHLGPVERERLLNGDWAVVDEGNMFKRYWFEVVDEEGVPPCQWQRYWDLAAVNPLSRRQRVTAPSSDPDWAAGALLGLSSKGQWYLRRIDRVQGTPLEIERLVLACARADGPEVPIAMEQEGGSGGVNTIDHYRRDVLVGYTFDRHTPRGTKAERAGPVSSAAQAGNLFLVRGAWVDAFLDEAELFDAGGFHDDQVDAVSGAFTMLRRRHYQQGTVNAPAGVLPRTSVARVAGVTATVTRTGRVGMIPRTGLTR